MTKRVKINLDKLRKSLPKAQKEYSANLADTLGAEIDKQIGKGTSPVAGVARYAEYKPSYKASIAKGYQGAGKRPRPVNLKVTGELRDSQKVGVTKDKLNVKYGDPKAKYHNEGTPKMARRPLLPTRRGEGFSRVITKFLIEQAKKVLTQFL